MGTEDRIGQLTNKQSVHVSCTRCGNNTALDARALLIQYGAKMTWAGIKRRLRCQRCGERKFEWRFGHQGGSAGIKLVDLVAWKDRPD